MFAFPRLGKFVAGIFDLSLGQTSTSGVESSLDMTWKVGAGLLSKPSLAIAQTSITPPALVGTLQGYLSALSKAQVLNATPICLRLFTQLMRCALGQPCRECSVKA